MNKQLLCKVLMGAMASTIKEVKQDLASHEVRIFGRELTESERTALCGLINFDKQHGTNQAEIFKESIKYAVAQEKALQAEQATDTNGHDQHGGIPNEVLQALSEKLGVPISDMHVVNGDELSLSDIFGLDDNDHHFGCNDDQFEHRIVPRNGRSPFHRPLSNCGQGCP